MTWAGPRYVQELATFLGPQNRTQGRCVVNYSNIILKIDRYPDNIFAFINSSNFKCPNI